MKILHDAMKILYATTKTQCSQINKEKFKKYNAQVSNQEAVHDSFGLECGVGITFFFPKKTFPSNSEA